ncbi:peptidoglycan-binding protein [Paenibacillus hodogayensis]|uniref:Peptidoglycan-binding protein n=1 Tax=Paenibacillus hodogayensis TaxID=279208 RepID=A0ABV5VWR9_9BACL
MSFHRQWKQTWIVVLASFVLVFGASSVASAFGKGAKGPDVFAVQGMLKSLGYFNGTITGYYGSETEAAVKRFQQKYNLPVTGAVDNKTLESILWAYASVKIPRQAPSPGPRMPTPAPQIPPERLEPEPAPENPPSEGLSAEERQMIELVNTARREAGLEPLEADLKLAEVARLKSRDMADNGYFSHQSPTYGSPFDMMQQFGIAYSSAGENIACNEAVQAAHEALMNSPGHRANILSGTFTRIGIGIVDGGSCGKMFTQQFIAE